MKNTTGNISFKYISGLIPKELLDEIDSNLHSVNIDFDTTDVSGVAMACYDEIIATLSLFFSDELTKAYILGLFTNSTYEIIRNSIVCLWGKSEEKKYNEVRNDSVREKSASLDINFKVKGNQLTFKLKGDCSDETKQLFIDRAFECVKTHQEQSSKHLLYFPDSQSKSWEMTSVENFIKEQKNKK